MNQRRSSAPTLDRIRVWRIHIGAHKTATTHLQEVLTLMRDALVAQGIDFIPNQEVRNSRIAKALKRRRPAMRVPVLRGRLIQDIMAETLDPLRRGPDRLVLSEEKLLGGPRHVFATPSYPVTEHLAANLESLGLRSDVTLFLSIRNLAGQLPSAYVQELMIMPPLEGGFDNLKGRILANPPRWSDLVARIRRAAPNTPLKVWRQEDYREHAAQILAELCGVKIPELPTMDDPYWTKTPSPEAVRAAESLPFDTPKDQRLAQVSEMFKALPVKETRFDPFSEAEKRRLGAAYEADLARIHEIGPDILMRF